MKNYVKNFGEFTLNEGVSTDSYDKKISKIQNDIKKFRKLMTDQQNPSLRLVKLDTFHSNMQKWQNAFTLLYQIELEQLKSKANTEKWSSARIKKETDDITKRFEGSQEQYTKDEDWLQDQLGLPDKTELHTGWRRVSQYVPY